MNQKRIDEIEARLGAATPGEWMFDPEYCGELGCGVFITGLCGHRDCNEPHQIGIAHVDGKDGEFIAHAKADIEWLLAENAQLREFKSYWDGCYGQGYEIAYFHENGETEPFDGFYESAMECYEGVDKK